MPVVSNPLGAVRYWAGQKLLLSPLHPFYLKVTGKEPKPRTYERWLAGERPGPEAPLDASRYELIVAPDAVPSPDAAYWLMREAERSGASHVYADEDRRDSATGRRHSPVFRPGWSPELAAHCDYIGGCYLRRLTDPGDHAKWAHVPRVLFHRSAPFAPSMAPAIAPGRSSALTSAIVCSRNPALLDSCFAALRTKSGGANLEPVAVLHLGQGRDDELRQVATRYGATVAPYRESFHFSLMCNVGAAMAKGEYLLFLNDDVTPLHPDWLHWMLSQAQRPGTGAVGAMLYFPDGRIQHAGVLLGTPNGAGHPGRLSDGSTLWPWLKMTREVSAVTGACMLTPRAVFQEVQGFDAGFPVNYNDVDFCLRAARQGYRIVFEARAELEHAESATRAVGIRYAERQRFLERWADELRRGDPFFNPNLSDDELLLPDAGAHQRILTRDG